MMSRQGIWLAGVVIASCLYGVGATAEEPRPRTVNVSGMAEVSAEPDIARITLGVESRKPKARAKARRVPRAKSLRLLARALKPRLELRPRRATQADRRPGSVR